MDLEKEQKVRLKDGRVGNFIESSETGYSIIRVPVNEPHQDSTKANRGVIRAGIEDIKIPDSDIETEWIEGPDPFGRYWNQNGKQVVYGPDGTVTLWEDRVV